MLFVWGLRFVAPSSTHGALIRGRMLTTCMRAYYSKFEHVRDTFLGLGMNLDDFDCVTFIN